MYAEYDTANNRVGKECVDPLSLSLFWNNLETSIGNSGWIDSTLCSRSDPAHVLFIYFSLNKENKKLHYFFEFVSNAMQVYTCAHASERANEHTAVPVPSTLLSPRTCTILYSSSLIKSSEDSCSNGMIQQGQANREACLNPIIVCLRNSFALSCIQLQAHHGVE